MKIKLADGTLHERPVDMQVQPEMCATCPFREGSPYANLAPELAVSALRDCSRVCHCTGRDNAIHRRTGKAPMLCRGARDVQLKYFANTGYIETPTDSAWDKKAQELKDEGFL